MGQSEIIYLLQKYLSSNDCFIQEFCCE